MTSRSSSSRPSRTVTFAPPQSRTSFHSAASTTGTYTGDGKATKTINLGAPILAILIEVSDGHRSQYGSTYVQGGMVLPDRPLGNNVIKISGNTFIVSINSSNNYWLMNTANQLYYYIALLQQ